MDEQHGRTNVQNLELHECILQPVTFEFSFVQSVHKEESPGSVVSSEGDDEEEEDEKDEDEEKQEDEEDGEDEDKQTPATSLPSQPLLIGSCSGFIETTVKIKQNDMLPGPKVCVSANFTSCSSVSAHLYSTLLESSSIKSFPISTHIPTQ